MSLSAKYRGRNKPKSISQMIYENVIVMFFILSRLVLFCFNLELFMYWISGCLQENPVLQ